MTKELLSLDVDKLSARLLAAVGDSTYPPIHTAVEWVNEKHVGQTRKDGSDFRAHPFRVALYLYEIAEIKDANVICAGLLHDIVEDTPTSSADVEDVFGPKVGDLVRSLTWPARPEGTDRSEHDLQQFENMRWDGRDAQIVKSADRLDNVLTIEGAFCDEHKEAYLKTTRTGALPLTLACNTALYHALNDALTACGCPE